MVQIIHILKQSGRLSDDFITVIKKSIRSTFKRAQKLVIVPSLDIVVMDDPQSVVPELGISGYAKNPTTIFLSIDPSSSYLRDNLKQGIASTVTHELHHVMRMSGVGYGNTLLEALVSEGLADHFDIELNQTEPKPWSIALKHHELKALSLLAEKEHHSRFYNHQDWFFGSKDEKIPRWAGYAIGFDLVGRYLEHRGLRPSQLIDVSANDFVFNYSGE